MAFVCSQLTHSLSALAAAADASVDDRHIQKWVIKAVSIALVLSGLLAADGYPDKLYTWTDAKGQWYISQTPPPEGVKVKDVFNYTPYPDPQKRPEPPQSDPPETILPDIPAIGDNGPLPEPAATEGGVAYDENVYYDPRLSREKIEESRPDGGIADEKNELRNKKNQDIHRIIERRTHGKQTK